MTMMMMMMMMMMHMVQQGEIYPTEVYHYIPNIAPTGVEISRVDVKSGVLRDVETIKGSETAAQS